MLANLTLLEARPDWLSCSAKGGAAARTLELIGNAGLRREYEAGDKPKPASAHGYVGTQCGSWRLASNEQAVLVAVSGVEAGLWAPTLLNYAEHVSRLDYCVTLQAPDPTFNPSSEVWQAWQRRRDAGIETPQLRELRELGGGASAALGSRNAGWYGRIYDKHAESDGLYPQGAWRYEVEQKRHVSEYEHEAVREDPKRLECIADLVRAGFDRWKVPCPWPPGAKPALACTPRRERDADRALRWLQEQVSPTVEWLSTIGRAGEMRDALGLAGFGLKAVGE